MLWGIILLLAGTAELATTMNEVGAGIDSDTNTNMGILQSIFQLEALDKTDTFTQVISIATNVWTIIKGLVMIFFLYFPTLWTGIWIWFWVLVCLPIGIGMCVAFLTILRGSGSS
jgi:sterol desaturase/sphingolipid hydroxylase (fatty acid hydroxylase superfamily)